MYNDNPHILIKEVCIDSFDQALIAEKRGASRLEICSQLNFDGLTPRLDDVDKIIKKISIPIKVMIRSRKGNFIYNEREVSFMEKEIGLFKAMGVKEFVFGALTKLKTIDLDVTKRLMAKVNPMRVTFHKAIDYTDDIMKQLEVLSDIQGITSILTSGGEKTAIEGTDRINQIVKKFGSRFNIIAAGSITNKNLETLSKQIKTSEFHGKAILGRL